MTVCTDTAMGITITIKMLMARSSTFFCRSVPCQPQEANW